MGRVVYMNGEFIPEAEAKVSIYSLDVMQSAAAFEMTRSFHGVHFKLREHLTRLVKSCRLLSIPVDTLAFSGIYDQCLEVSARNDHGPGEEHRLLIVVSPGCAPMYKELAGVIPHPFIYIADFPLRYTVQGFSPYFLEGVHCVTSTIQQVPDACIPSAAKHRSRLHFHLAQQQVPAGTWPVLKSEGGLLTEAPGANLVYVQTVNGRQRIRTIAEHCLPGISLQTIRELVLTEEVGWRGTGDSAVDELWLTGTPFCMLPVVSLDGKPIGDGQIGPVYQQTLAKWSAMVGLDIAQQIIDWDEDPAVGTLWTPRQQRILEARAARLDPTQH